MKTKNKEVCKHLEKDNFANINTYAAKDEWIIQFFGYKEQKGNCFKTFCAERILQHVEFILYHCVCTRLRANVETKRSKYLNYARQMNFSIPNKKRVFVELYPE